MKTKLKIEDVKRAYTRFIQHAIKYPHSYSALTKIEIQRNFEKEIKALKRERAL